MADRARSALTSKQVTVAVIIPALNEEQAIGSVLAAIPAWADDRGRNVINIADHRDER